MPDKIVKEKNVVYLTPKTRKIIRRLLLVGGWVVAVAYIYKLRADNEVLEELVMQLMDANNAFEALSK